MTDRATVLLILSLTIATPVAADSLDEVVAGFIDARGGREAIDAVQSVRATGRMIFPNGVEQPFLYEWKRPNKIRFEVTLQGLTEIQASDGATQWHVDPPGIPEPQPLPPRAFVQLNDGVDYIGPLVDWREKGHKLTLRGKADVDGTEAYEIEIVKSDGMTEVSFLDAEYFLEILQIEHHPLPDGGTMEFEVTWSDYKKVGGVLLPHAWNRKPKGAPAGLTLMFEEIEVNPEIPDARFTEP